PSLALPLFLGGGLGRGANAANLAAFCKLDMAERIPPVVRPAGDRQADCRLLRLRVYDGKSDLIAARRQIGGQRECLRQGALTGQPALDRGFAGQEDAGIAALAGQPTVTASLMPFWEYSPRRACIHCCDEGFLRGRQR